MLPKFAPSSMHLAGRAPTAIIPSLARPASAPTTKWATLARAVERHDHLALPEHFNRPTAARRVDSTIDIAATLLLQPNELFALAAVFRDLDADANGVVDVEEFLARVGVRAPFARRVFSIFDADGDGRVDFREFVVALWQFCTADDVGECAFRCFATLHEGVYEVGAAERAYLVDAVHHPSNEAARVSFGLVDTSLGAEVRGGRRREATRKSLAKLGDGAAVGLQAWNAWVSKHPEIATPFRLARRALRAACGGDEFWRRVAGRRRDHGLGSWLDVEATLAVAHNFGASSRGRRGRRGRAPLRSAEEPPPGRRGAAPLPRIASGVEVADAAAAERDTVAAYCARRAAYVIPDADARRRFLDPPRRRKLPRTVLDRPGPRDSLYT